MLPLPRKSSRLFLGLGSMSIGLSSLLALTAEYSIGPVTQEEQHAIELINRARLNPQGEAPRILPQAVKNGPKNIPEVVDVFKYFGVVGTEFASQMNSVAVAPPLAPNSLLTEVAKAHSQWMFQTTLQEHDELPGQVGGDIAERIKAKGYQFKGVSENIYTLSLNTYYSHLGFEVDWGDSFSGLVAFGMQVPPSHRNNIHDPNMREIGIGIVQGTKLDGQGWPLVGPQIGTQDFGRAESDSPFITGVVWNDRNNSGEFEAGEGISGVKIEVEGANHFAVSAVGGGYAIPLARENKSYVVKFSQLNATHQLAVAVTNFANQKVDFKTSSALPMPTPSSQLTIGVPGSLNWSPIVGATSYTVLKAQKSPVAGDNCDTLAAVTPTVSAGYTVGVLQANTRDGASGNAWHLAHRPPPAGAPPVTQLISFNSTYFVGPSAAISFRSRLARAFDNQQARVQISNDDGHSWKDLWWQPGASADGGSAAAGETAFNTRSLASELAPYANRLVKLRLAYTYTQIGNGSYVSGSGANDGWFVDNIVFTNIFSVNGITETPATGTSFPIAPSSATTSLYAVRPIVNGGAPGWSYGPVIEPSIVTATGYAAWAIATESSMALPAGTLSTNLLNDLDGDGVNNLLEYAQGTSPGASSSKAVLAPVATSSGVTLNYAKSNTAMDVSLVPEGSIDLVNWYSPGEPGAPFTIIDSVVAPGSSTQNRSVSVSASSGVPIYVRLLARKL